MRFCMLDNRIRFLIMWNCSFFRHVEFIISIRYQILPLSIQIKYLFILMSHSFKAYYREQEIAFQEISQLHQISEQLSLKYPQFKDGCICMCQITSFSHLVKVLELNDQHPQFPMKIRVNPLLNEKLMEKKKNPKIVYKGSKLLQEMKLETMNQRHQKNVSHQQQAIGEKKELKRYQSRDNLQEEINIKKLRQSMIEVLKKQLQTQREKNKLQLKRQLKQMKQQFQKARINELKQQLQKHTNKVINLQQKSEENIKDLTVVTNSLKQIKEFNQGAKIRQLEHREKDKSQLEQIKKQINRLKQHRPVATNNYGSIQTNQTYNKVKEKISQEISRQINKIKYDLETNRNNSINKIDQATQAKLKQSIKRQLMNQIDNKNHYIDQQINLIKSEVQMRNKKYFDNFQKDVEWKITRKLEQFRKKHISKKNQQLVDEYNQNYKKIISQMIDQQQPSEIKQNENKAIDPSINLQTLQNHRMAEDNPLIDYRLQFEGIQKNTLKQQQKESSHIQNNNDFKTIQNETKEPIQTPFEKQSSHNKHISTLQNQYSQVKTQENKNIKKNIMESSSLKKIQSPQKTKKNQQKNKKINDTKPLALQQKRKQYSYKLVDTIQYVTLKPKENYTWNITLSNDGPDWEDQMTIVDKNNNKYYKVGMLKGNNLIRVHLGPFLQYKTGIFKKQFAIGYKIKKGSIQIFHQIGDIFKLIFNVIELGITKQKQFEERINYLIKIYLQKNKIIPKPMQQILQCFQQVGITQKTFADTNEEVLVDLLMEIHSFRK